VVGRMKVVMTLAVALLLAGCFPAAAGEDEVGINVLHSLSFDYATCAAYHLIFKQCAPEGTPEEQLALVQSWAEKAVDGMTVSGEAAGMSDAALAANRRWQ
jgi:hypothetical protein